MPDAPPAPRPIERDAAAAGRPLLTALFAATVRRHAERVAIDVPPSTARPERRTMTYGELDAVSGAIARSLLAAWDGAPSSAAERIVPILLGRDTPNLYAAQLGVLRAGGAFTCLDAAFPDGHLRSVIEDAGASVVLADQASVERLAAIAPEVAALDVAALVAAHDRPLSEPDPAQLAYVIYTSGTTGTPKGVMIEHRSIAHLVGSDVEHFALSAEDRVAQCSSPAYDSSLEETWLAFAVGATLVPLNDETVRLGPDLVPWLRRERISVFCPPPTLLRTTGCRDPRSELPDLRLLYVGGEALPQDLADRWGAACWLENGYGPTECTVTVVRGRMQPGVPVSIGRPVEGHRAWILDERFDRVLDGEAGELCIAGPGLARGYHGRPELTAERFPMLEGLGRVYRTGDLVRVNERGDLEYLGRIDGQVKLRGYRVELPAIEATIAAFPGVREAACAVQVEAAEGEAGGAQVLVAHVVPQDPDAPPGAAALRDFVRHRLPGYMVPARIAMIEALPTSIGGKLDRKRLPPIAAQGDARPASRAEGLPGVVATIFARATRASEVGLDDDFFLDLGGDSLSAVAVVCSLRSEPATRHAAVRDLYDARTARRLAERLAATPPAGETRVAEPPAAAGRPHPVVASIEQAAWLAAGLAGWGFVAYLVLCCIAPAVVARIGVVATILVAPLASFAFLLASAPLAVGATALVKRLVVGRYEPCRIPVWSGAYVRHWMVEQTARLIPWGMLEGTELMSIALRALGAKVGRRVHVHRGVDLRHGGWDLLALGDDVTLGQEASLKLVDLEAGHLVVGPIALAEGATVATRAGLAAGSSLGRDASLAPLAWLGAGQHIPDGERWDGVPAARIARSSPPPSLTRGAALTPLGHAGAMLLARFVQHLLASLPWIAVGLAAARFDAGDGRDLPAWIAGFPIGMAILGAILAVPLGLLAEAIGLRLFGSVEPGVISVRSAESIRVWLTSGAVDSAGRWLSGTLFWPRWLRLAGMRIGPGCEISTIIDVVPSLVGIGEESFFADGIYLASPEVHRGTIALRTTRLGRNTFLGNHAVVPAGHVWPDDFFVGVSTVADPRLAKPGTGWFGHPPLALPRREVVEADRSVTHEPSLPRVVSRYFWESLRFALLAWPIAVAFGWWAIVARWSGAGFLAAALVGAPLATAAAVAALAGMILGLKWILLGRTRPGQHPLWSCWCSRWDFLYVAWAMYARGLLGTLEGTVFLTWFLRASGVRIGKGVLLGHGFAQVVDPDMLVFEDGATVNCHFQAHSFEDRILKMDRLVVRRGASVGTNAVVFYGADIGEGSRVEPHTVVMKRERLDAEGIYAGAPAVCVGRMSGPSPNSSSARSTGR